jgi:hypothetical protein
MMRTCAMHSEACIARRVRAIGHVSAVCAELVVMFPARRDEMKYGGDEWSRSERANFVMDIVALMVIGLLIVTTAAFCSRMLP